MTLYPNGLPAIWIQDSEGNGFEIKASNGPAAFAVEVRPFVGSVPVTLDIDDSPEVETRGRVTLCQYRRNEWAQAYKAWYFNRTEGAGFEGYPGTPEEFYAKREAAEKAGKACEGAE